MAFERKGVAVKNFLAYVSGDTLSGLDELVIALGYSSRAELVRKVLTEYVARTLKKVRKNAG